MGGVAICKATPPAKGKSGTKASGSALPGSQLNRWAWGARDLLHSRLAAGGSLGEELGTQRRSQISLWRGDPILRDKRQSPGGAQSARRAEGSGSSPMEDKQILCVGLVVLDIISVVDKYPEEDTDSR